MLVITRKHNETIRIADDIEVIVIEIVGNRARLGITAPHDVPIRRGELVQSPPADFVVCEKDGQTDRYYPEYGCPLYRQGVTHE